MKHGDNPGKGFRVASILSTGTGGAQLFGPNPRRCGLIVSTSAIATSTGTVSFDGNPALLTNSLIFSRTIPLILGADVVEGVLTGPIFADAGSAGVAITGMEIFYL